MNGLASIGLILLFALLAGHLVKFLRVPEVTGYILAGVALGPSVLGWVTHENLSTLGVFSEVALGLILFSLGSAFEWGRLRRLGPSVLRLALVDAAVTPLLVGGCAWLLGQSWQVSVLLGAVAMETAAASTLMVLRECNASGPLTELLTALLGVNNVLCLFAYYLAAALLGLHAHTDTSVYEALFPLVWQLIGSVALGYLAGLLLSGWASRVVEHGEMLILLIGCVLLCVGVAQMFRLSALIATLAVGATMANLSTGSRRFLEALSRTDPPLYAIFFVTAGADLNLGLLRVMGVVGLAYLVCRAVGKFGSIRLGALLVGLGAPVRRALPFAVMSHAGLAVGLTLSINRRFPEYAPAVTAVILASVALYEMAGPLLARQAITRSGEARPRAGEPGLEGRLEPAGEMELD